MKVVFMGTPEFAVPSLKAVMARHQVVAVVTQPDKPKGRGRQMACSPIKELALERNIPVLQPVKVREPEAVSAIAQFAPDIIVVVAFGQILSKELLDMPRFGCINVHGSLLPKYRGAAPMQWSVINGEEQTGITTMYMAEGLDSGDMLLKETMPITKEDTYGSIYEKMKALGAKVLMETLDAIENGVAVRTPQKHEEATLAPMIVKETGHIQWSKTSDQIINLIRGLNPAPNAYTEYDGQVIKIWSAQMVEEKYENQQAGQIVLHTKKGFVVKTGDAALLVTEVQAKGGKRMGADAYLRGHALPVGTILS